jgi:hypothetical protein
LFVVLQLMGTEIQAAHSVVMHAGAARVLAPSFQRYAALLPHLHVVTAFMPHDPMTADVQCMPHSRHYWALLHPVRPMPMLDNLSTVHALHPAFEQSAKSDALYDTKHANCAQGCTCYQQLLSLLPMVNVNPQQIQFGARP